METCVGRIRNGTLYFYVERQETAVDIDCSQQLQSTTLIIFVSFELF